MNRHIQEEIDALIAWVTLQAEELAARGAVVHLGGDVNSSVTLAITKRVFGDKTFGLILPCRDGAARVQDAQWVAHHFEVPFEILDLSPAHDSLVRTLDPRGERPRAILKNGLQMLAHRHYSDMRGLLMVGSVDRAEYELSEVPGHPNPLADIIPLEHLLSVDLRRWGRHLGLPRRILQRSRPLDLKSEQPLRNGIKSQPTPAQIDAFLAGDTTKISPAVQEALQALRTRVAGLRKLPRHNRADGPTPAAEASIADEHDAYDRSIEALSLISKAITSDQYLEDILRLIVMVTAEVMKSSVCSLWLLDEKESVLRLRATQSIDSEYLKDRVLKVGEGVVGKVVAESRAYAVSNVLTDPIFKEKDLARRMGLVSMLSVPMLVGERVIGVINCYTSHPHVFSDLQMNLLTTVANQAAVAIEKTELMVKTKVISEELERRKIIERAKDILMKRLSLSGEEAYRWLQKRSMNTRKSMREVSEAVLLAMEG